jgi:hypothetical protein
VVAAAVLSVLVLCCGVACVGGFRLLEARYTPCVPGRPAGLTAEDLIGRYVSSRGGQLVLETSGTFKAQGIEIDFDGRTLSLSGPGEWSLLPGDDGFGDISLRFDEARFATYMRVSGTRPEPWLYWYIGDPDSCVIERFERA